MYIDIPSAPSSEQLQLLQAPPRPVEIIKGAAGSGKTFTAICKLIFTASYMASNGESLDIQILSFNRTLKAYISEVIEIYKEKYNIRTNITPTVDTFAKWAAPSPNINITSAKDFLQNCGQGLSLYNAFSQDFLSDEIQYVLKRFPYTNLDTYLSSVRHGRGTLPAFEEEYRKILLYEYIHKYFDWKKQNDVFDWEDIAWQACSSHPSKYDIIVVDEGQDFTANQYRAVVNSLKDDSCLICVIDTAQKIYLNGFTWTECGIDAVRNKPFTLKRNFRNTKEISLLAAKILESVTIDNDGVMPEQNASISSETIPLLLIGVFSKQINYMIQEIKEYLSKGESCVILFKSEKWSQYTKRKLKENNIEFNSITRESEWPNNDINLVISTMHSAKGLEFDHVFIPGINSKLFPTSYPNGDEAIQQDRRLLAMAIGRARKTVTLGEKYEEKSGYFDNIDESILKRICL